MARHMCAAEGNCAVSGTARMRPRRLMSQYDFLLMFAQDSLGARKTIGIVEYLRMRQLDDFAPELLFSGVVGNVALTRALGDEVSQMPGPGLARVILMCRPQRIRCIILGRRAFGHFQRRNEPERFIELTRFYSRLGGLRE